MTLRHLKIFITVADCGKMGVAADQLFISQPSVSQAIREIEKHYEVRLFERLSKRLYITEAGEELLKYARHIIQSCEEMELALKQASTQMCLRIGATITVGTCMLWPTIKGFEKEYEKIQTKVTINNTNVIEQMLLQSQLDVGIVEGKITHSELIKQAIYKDEVVLVVGKMHPFYKKQRIKVEELEGQSLVCREQGSGIRSLFEQLLQTHQINMPIKWECTNMEAIKTAVIGGEGIAAFSKLMIKEEVENEKLHIITLEGIELSRDICVVWHKNKFISNYLKTFLEMAAKLEV